MKIVNTSFGYTKKSLEKFSDVNENNWYYSKICISINAGYMDSKQLNFKPKYNITISEAVVTLSIIK